MTADLHTPTVDAAAAHARSFAEPDDGPTPADAADDMPRLSLPDPRWCDDPWHAAPGEIHEPHWEWRAS